MKINRNQQLQSNFKQSGVNSKKEEGIKDRLTLGGTTKDLEIMPSSLQSVKSNVVADGIGFVEGMAVLSLMTGGLGAIGSGIGGPIGGIGATLVSALIGNKMTGPSGGLVFGAGAAAGAVMGGFTGAVVGTAIPAIAMKTNFNNMNDYYC